MNNTLFVSDLDGTLLLPDESLSDYTANILNNLINHHNLKFCYATARSFVTAQKVTKNLTTKAPAIIYNGTFITYKGEFLLSNFFDNNDVDFVKNLALKYNVFPIVYAFKNEKERFAYLSSYHTTGQDSFVNSRNDFRKTLVHSEQELFSGNVFYYTFIGNKDKLKEMYPLCKDRFNCYYQDDIYSGEKWLELLPKTATKANAATKLKGILGCEKIVAFGDGINDIPLFEIADECYAVANADQKLKAVATGIIQSNTNDGVAKFLEERFLL